MSLCNTFRLLAVGVALAVSITNANAFTFRRTTTIRGAGDLTAEETRYIDSKNTTKPPSLNGTKGRMDNVTSSPVNTAATIQDQGQTNKENKTSIKIIITTLKYNSPITSHIVSLKKGPKKKSLHSVITTSKPVELTTAPTVISLNKSTNSNFTIDSTATNANITIHKKTSHLQKKNDSRNNTIKTETSTEPNDEKRIREIIKKSEKMKMAVNGVTLVPWKKYTSITRNRIPAEDVINSTKENAPEVTTHSATSLRDTITSDIPSLERLKNDLLSLTSDIKLDHTNDKISTFVPHNPGRKSSDYITSSERLLNVNSKWSVETKRAGFLDYSEKNKPLEVADVTTNTNQDVTTFGHNNESQTQQMGDSLKHLLLQERVDDGIIDKASDKIDSTVIEFLPTQISTASNSQNEISDDNLQSKGTSVEKVKNASLYAVSPNYKPLKKLEVQPPKAFVRDPDDNSWRNESISSLGIVFKPKNSSIPFTQVLRNKTETEWNSLSEKENKNDIPDLRERLEHMTKMRKTKRKKIDSLGNVVYVDYEENTSSSEKTGSNENMNPLQDDISLLNFDPQFLLTTSRLPLDFTTTSDQPEMNTFTPTYKIKNNKETTVTTRKPKKTYNILDYYESTENEGAEYLDLAKIDIKKTSQTPLVAWPIINYETTKTEAPERKATLQFFPPTTKKTYKHKHPIDQDSYVTTYRPANPMRALYPETTVPGHDKISHHTGAYDEMRLTQKPTTVDTDTHLRQSPRNEEPINRYRVLSDEGDPVRGSYVVKSYDDFVSDKENDFDRNVEYVPYTEPTIQSATTNEVLKDDGLKENYDEDLEYDAKFRKDVISRFVDNFNRNSERFRSGFPVIFNSSIVHQTHDDGREAASSRAFLRGLSGQGPRPPVPYMYSQYDPHRENMTIELAPTYEFHYFVPEQEQTQEAEQRPS